MLKKIILFIVISTVFISGCSMQEERIGQPDPSPNQEDSIVIEKKTTIIEDSEYKIFVGAKKGFQDLKPEYFFKNIEALKEEQSEELGMKMWTDENENYLATSLGEIYYKTSDFYSTYEYLLYNEYGNLRDDLNEICNNSEITGLSKEQVITTISSIVDNCGIDIKEKEIFALDKVTLEKLSTLFMSDKEYEEYISDATNEPLKRDFMEQDEAYLIIMKPSIGEYQLYNKDYRYTNVMYTGSTMFALVNKDGMQAFMASSIYEADSDKTKTTSIIDIDTAVKKLQEKYADLILDSQIECKDIQLTYVAWTEDIQKGTFQFIPAYVFLLQQEQGDEKAGDDKQKVMIEVEVLLDAENGEWIE